MNSDILIPILTLAAISVGAGLLLNHFGNSSKYDERQLIERGKAASFAMNTAIVYLIGISTGYIFDLLPKEYMTIFAVWGMLVTLMVHTGYCIFRDAHLTAEKEPLIEALKYGAFGCVPLMVHRFNDGEESDWINLALAVEGLGIAAMLLIHALVRCIRDRRSAEEDTNGEE